jgi:hypothetical protein
MLRCVALVRTDVSEELRASIIRVTRIGELGTLALTSNRRTLRSQIFWVAVGLERGPRGPFEDKWGATWKKISGSGLENWD